MTYYKSIIARLSQTLKTYLLLIDPGRKDEFDLLHYSNTSLKFKNVLLFMKASFF